MLSHLILIGVSVAQLAAAPSLQAKAAFDRGEKALAGGQLDAAASAYGDAIAASPNYAEALNGLGSVLFKQGKRDDALTQFKASIAADPNFKLAYFNLGYAARKTGDFSTAAQAYEKYTRLDPADPDGFWGLGESYRQSGQPQRALAAYEQFLAKEKRPTEQKWIDKAKENIAALKAAPVPQPTATASNTPPPANSNGTPPPVTNTNSSAQQAPPSQTQPQPQNTAVAPGGATPSLALRRVGEGDRLMGEKKYREASFAYQDATNADPQNIEATFKLGNAYAVLGYYNQAIDRWNKVIQISPDPAIRKGAQDNIDKARVKMASAGGGSPQAEGRPPGSGPVADPTRAQARKAYESGVQQINGRDYAGAAQSLTQAIQLEPSLAVAYVARGSANIGLRRYSEAAADYQYAMRLDSNMGSPLYGLAEAYRALGRTAAAKEFYEKYVACGAPDVRPDLQAEARQKADRLR